MRAEAKLYEFAPHRVENTSAGMDTSDAPLSIIKLIVILVFMTTGYDKRTAPPS